MRVNLAEEETLRIDIADGAGMVVRRYARADSPRLIISHGNGFAIDGYCAFWKLLAADYELVLFDQRNHGRNPRGPIQSHTITAMAGDHLAVQTAVKTAWGERWTAGLFHSVSSIAAIKASAGQDAHWDALVLFDPPLIASEGHELRSKGQRIDDILADFARNRPQHFDHVGELAALYRAQIGKDWVQGAELDMARAVTREDPAGGCFLACPGEYEARIYLENARFESFKALASLRQPTLIIGADPTYGRPMPPAIVGPHAAEAHGLPHIIVPATGHMLQIEKPDLVAGHAHAFLAQQLKP